MEVVALVVEILEFDFVQDGAVHEFFRAEAVIDHGAGAQVFHARLHGAALVARRAVIGAENGEKLALVLDHHAGAKLCGFNAAHKFARPESGRETPYRMIDSFRKFQTAARRSGAWNNSPAAGRHEVRRVARQPPRRNSV